MMASKFLHDEGEEDSVVNEEWAASAHMDLEELNELERSFLTALVYVVHLQWLVAAKMLVLDCCCAVVQLIVLQKHLLQIMLLCLKCWLF